MDIIGAIATAVLSLLGAATALFLLSGAFYIFCAALAFILPSGWRRKVFPGSDEGGLP